MSKITGGNRLEKLILSIREPIRGGWMLNAYNQTYKKDCSFTITTRIDGANEHFITVDYGMEDNAESRRQGQTVNKR